MSAAEKLAALDAAMTSGRWWFDGRDILLEQVSGKERLLIIPLPQTFHYEQQVRDADSRGIVLLRNALPALREVVKAAETAHDEPYEDGIWWRTLGDALVRLNDVLGEGEPTPVVIDENWPGYEC